MMNVNFGKNIIIISVKLSTRLYLLEEKGMDKGCRRLDVPFGNDEVLTEGTRGAEITKGGTELIEVRDMGANGVTADIDVGMDRFGILPIPRVKIKQLMI